MRASVQTAPNHVVVFTLGELRYALPLSAVERVVRAPEVTPLPKAPEIVLGVINVRGQVIPVVDIRKHLRLPPRELELSDQFIIARTSRRRVALVADSVVGCHELADRELVPVDQVLPGAEYIHSVAKLEGNLVLICDLDQFPPFDEEQMLDETSSRDTE